MGMFKHNSQVIVLPIMERSKTYPNANLNSGFLKFAYFSQISQ